MKSKISYNSLVISYLESLSIPHHLSLVIANAINNNCSRDLGAINSMDDCETFFSKLTNVDSLELFYIVTELENTYTIKFNVIENEQMNSFIELAQSVQAKINGNKRKDTA